ncbi:MAG: hypothetical protein RLZZ598_122 [Pseudomonadota bacterium]|jgi:hypothetical protein
MSGDRRDVRQDPALGMVGAFRPLRKGPRGKLDVQMEWGDTTIRWRGPDQLGIVEQSVLLAVLEVAMEQLRGDQHTLLVKSDDALWSLLGHQKHVFRPDIMRILTSFRRLSLLCGKGDSGAELNLVRDALRRLAETTVWVSCRGKEGSSHLLGWQVSDEQQVVLVLNWRLTQALQGEQYARISMQERSQLASEPAKALHAVLSCKVNVGKAWNCTLDHLQPYVWGDTETQGANRRKRHGRLRAVLDEIARLPGWTARVVEQNVRVARGSASAEWKRTLRDGGSRSSGPVVSVTPRRNGHETPDFQARTEELKPSNDVGFQLVDVSVLISLKR